MSKTSTKNSTNGPWAPTANSIALYEKRYLDKKSGEDINGLWDRVSGGNERFRRLMSEGLFLPNSPTLFNAGLNNGCTLAACFVFDVEDSMLEGKNSICEVRNKAIAIAKAGGGVGYYGGKLRPKNSPIKSVNRVACGPVGVLSDYHGISKLIRQGGKRELAQMFVLPCWHTDIRGFIHCKDEDPQGLGSFNLSVGWTDLALQGERNGKPSQGADHFKLLWDEQCQSAWKTGCPGMLFPDVVNRANPNIHLGVINATNPCGETPNRTDEPCNLGSLAICRFFSPGDRSVNWNRLEEATRESTDFMDDILDRNVFPHPDITAAANLTRKLGLGVMGWADLLAMCHIHYDTPEAVALARKTMAFIAEVSLDQSVKLAKVKGPYPGYSDKTQGPMCRNETRTSIAPTGSIAILIGLDDSQSIEPHYAGLDSVIERTTAEGMKMDVSSARDKFDGFIPKTAHQVGLEWHVAHQAAFQAHTDLGVSKTINLPRPATVEDVSRAYRLMYDSGCKGGTIFRDGCRDEQVLVRKTSSVYSLPGTNGNGESMYPQVRSVVRDRLDKMTEFELAAFEDWLTDQVEDPKREGKVTTDRKLTADRIGVTHKFRIGGVKGYLTVNTFADGTMAEMFLRISKQGSTMAGMLDTWAMCFSNALQSGKPLAELVALHVGSRFEPSGLTGNPDVPVCTSIPDYVVRWLQRRFLPKVALPSPVPAVTAVNGTDLEATVDYEETTYGDSGALCPDCGSSALYKAGCLTCSDPKCGWSRCG